MGKRKLLGVEEKLMGRSSEVVGGSPGAAWPQSQCGAVWVGNVSRPVNPAQSPFLLLLRHIPQLGHLGAAAQLAVRMKDG